MKVPKFRCKQTHVQMPSIGRGHIEKPSGQVTSAQRGPEAVQLLHDLGHTYCINAP